MRRISALFVCLALVFGACGGQPFEPPGSAPTEDASFPVTIQAANGDVEIAAKPIRIVSLSSTATEMLFSIGAGEQVVAVDDQSDYPPGVPTTELSGYKPNVEAIANYQPDLVVHSSESGGLTDSLKSLNIPVIVQPAAKKFDDTYQQIEQLGRATGHSNQARELVDDMKAAIKKIVAGAPKSGRALTYYHELDNTYFTVTSKTFIGQVYGLLGLKNIADPADKDASGYPQISAEFIIQANPDFIFLGDSECCNQTPELVSKRPGWDQISAVERGAVFDVGDDISSRWGPRIVDFLQIVVDAIHGKAPGK